MIDLSQEVLVSLMVRSFLCGLILGVVYDVIRTVKMFFGVSYCKTESCTLPSANKVILYIVTFLTDLIFWLFTGLISIALLYQIGGGVFRGMTYACMAIGFVIYYFTLGRLILKLNSSIVSFIKKLLNKLVALMLLPVKKAVKGIIYLYHLTIGKIIGKIKEEWCLSRAKKRECAQEEFEALSDGVLSDGKEDLVYVDGRTGYRKSGRVSFGGKSSK